MKWTGTAYLQDGVLKLRNTQSATKFCQSLNANEFLVTIEKKKSKRSLSQNTYYWSCVVPTVLHGFTELGNNMDLEMVHEFIKSEFNYIEIVNMETAEVKRVPKSTASLSKSEFSDMIDKLNIFCSEWFGFNIPEAGQQTEIVYK